MKGLFKSYLLKLKLLHANVDVHINTAVNWLNSILAILVVGSLIYVFGFRIVLGAEYMRILYMVAFISFMLEYIYLTIKLIAQKFQVWKTIWVVVISLIMLSLCITSFLPEDIINRYLLLRILKYHYTLIIAVSILSIFKVSYIITNSLRTKLSPNWIFVGSFIFLILSGAGLLMLPNCSVGDLSFLQALFTSVSAVCVTGLSVVDVSLVYTPTGQAIILILIQLGGIGIMTFTSFFGLIFVKKHTSQNKMLIKDLIDPNSGVKNIFTTLQNIIIVTIIIEAIGAWFIYESLEIGGTNGAAIAIFHSISAFCNAGFSTLPNGLYNDIFKDNIFALQTVSWLIILGGIGFPIMFNMNKLVVYTIKNKVYLLAGKRKKYAYKAHVLSSNSILVIIITSFLLISGTAIFLITEYNNVLQGMPILEKINMAFFMSVTPRTAGFNAFDMGELSSLSVTFMIIFMWVGASPMSTAGGVKTTTIGIALLNIWNTLRGRNHIEIRRRKVSQMTVNRAFIIIFVSLIVIATGCIFISAFDPQYTLQSIIFEVVSAFSTVGLSLNITDKLSENSQIVLIFIMFIGRMGLLTVLSCFIPEKQYKRYEYPTESIPIN